MGAHRHAVICRYFVRIVFLYIVLLRSRMPTFTRLFIAAVLTSKGRTESAEFLYADRMCDAICAGT